jgi:hypothetical protein
MVAPPCVRFWLRHWTLAIKSSEKNQVGALTDTTYRVNPLHFLDEDQKTIVTVGAGTRSSVLKLRKENLASSS